MSRSGVIIAVLAGFGFACGLTGSGPAESTSSGGGVPISKPTPTPEDQQPAPTEPPIVPTANPTSAPAPSEPRPQMDGSAVLEIVDVFIVEEISQLIGVVRNVSDIEIHNLGFDFNFHDAAGTIVQTKHGSSLLYSMPAGSINVFEIYFPSGVPATAEAVSIDVTWIEGAPLTELSRTAIQVEQQESNVDEQSNLYRVTGVIRNTTDRKAEHVALLGIAYGKSDRLIGQTTVTAQELSAGETAPFALALQLDRLPEEVGRFEILTEARLED